MIGTLNPLVPTDGLLLVLIAKTLDRVDTVCALDGCAVTRVEFSLPCLTLVEREETAGK